MHSVVYSAMCLAIWLFLFTAADPTHLQGPAVKDISTIVHFLNALIIILGNMFIFYLLFISAESDHFKM